MSLRTLLLALPLLATTGCSVAFDIGPYDVGTPLGGLQGATADQCPPTLAGVAIEDLGQSCRIGAVYEGVFVDGARLTADVDAGLATAATLVGLVTRVRSGSLSIETAQMLGGDGAPPPVTWRDLHISLWLDGGTEHIQDSTTVPNATGISFSAPLSAADLSVLNAVLDAPTTSDLSGDLLFQGTLSLADIQVLADAGALSLDARIGADLRIGL